MDNASPDAPPARELPLPFVEFVVIIAGVMALTALAIDIMLPALGDIASDYNVEDGNARQLVVGVYLITFGGAQLVFGPLVDRFGRRRVLIGSALGYGLAAGLAIFTHDYWTLLATRALQGVAGAGARVAAAALVRDVSSGRRMAEIMSLAMTAFLIVPILAPGLGQVILLAAPWPAIFGALFVYGALMGGWMYFRLPETLPADQRTPLRFDSVFRGYRIVAQNRLFAGYALASAMIFGSLFAFVNSSEQIFIELFDVGPWFPLAFGASAISFAIATTINSRIVGRLGMRRISQAGLIAFTAVNVLHVLTIIAIGESLFSFLAFSFVSFFCFGLIGANFNAIAMEPIGDHAGAGAAGFGFATTTISAVLGGIVGQLYNGSTLPLAIGYAGFGAAALAVVFWLEGGRLFQVSEHPA